MKTFGLLLNGLCLEIYLLSVSFSGALVVIVGRMSLLFLLLPPLSTTIKVGILGTAISRAFPLPGKFLAVLDYKPNPKGISAFAASGINVVKPATVPWIS